MAKRPRPPKTRRICPICNRTTTFEYDPCIFHSRCTTCGAHIGATRSLEQKKEIK